jgi:hypothetical protein
LLFPFVKGGFDLLAISNVAIDLNQCPVIEQLLPAFYNDFAAIFADMPALRARSLLRLGGTRVQLTRATLRKPSRTAIKLHLSSR